MKLLKNILPVLFIVTLVLTMGNCNRKNAQNNEVKLDANCQLTPEPGPCKGAFKMYYFDQEEKTCKSFIWGGCNGVVPFKTLEECQEKCNCK